MLSHDVRFIDIIIFVSFCLTFVQFQLQSTFCQQLLFSNYIFKSKHSTLVLCSAYLFRLLQLYLSFFDVKHLLLKHKIQTSLNKKKRQCYVTISKKFLGFWSLLNIFSIMNGISLFCLLCPRLKEFCCVQICKKVNCALPY